MYSRVPWRDSRFRLEESSVENASVDLASYGGIALAVVALIGASKRLFKTWVKGKEPILALAFSLALGVAAKLTGLFPGEPTAAEWLKHIVLLVLTAAGSGLVHDKIVNPVLMDKDKK